MLALSPQVHANMVNPCLSLELTEVVRRTCGGILAKYVIEPTIDEITADAFIILKRFFHGVRSQYERKRKAKETAERFINRIDTFAGLSEDISLSTVDSDEVLYQSAIESGGLKNRIVQEMDGIRRSGSQCEHRGIS